ncbi:hypothetical protein PG990_011152 [Apiospora arundinis]|uniref:Uncharacterized protein n=1 Tax=Apiospora arundinis TaxID=335852 RepID=A0ABR2JHC6_9PEZI
MQLGTSRASPSVQTEFGRGEDPILPSGSISARAYGPLGYANIPSGHVVAHK